MSQERIVSPGVFTRENDITYLPQGVGEIGAAIIGPTEKGRAFVPEKIYSNTEFTQKYGGKTDESYTAFAVESYLQDAGNITVTRILGLDGYTENTIPLIINTTTGSFLAGVLHPSRTVDSDTAFKSTFLASASFSSSYNGYDYAGSAMTTLNVNINKGGTLLVSGLAGTLAGTFYSANSDGMIISASGANIVVSGSLSGSVIGSVIGLENGTAITESSYTFTGSLFSGSIGGAANLEVVDGLFGVSTVTTSTVASGLYTMTAGTTSGSVSTVAAHFTSSVIPDAVGAAFVKGNNIIFASDFFFTLKDDQYPLSLDPTSVNYIGKVYGYSPKTTLNTSFAEDKDKAYNYLLFENKLTSLVGLDTNATVSTASVNINLLGDQYMPAETPWITSQILGGKAHNLFKVVTLGDGNYSNSEIKIGILNVKKSGEVGGTNYGSFSLVVRTVSDTDKQQNVIETYSDLNLDPTSPNYICRVIGDKYPTFTVDTEGMSRIIMTGDYDNKSKYIRIVIDDNVKYQAYDASLVPWGFKAYYTPFNATALGSNTVPPVTYTTDQTYNSEYNSRVYYGFNFDFVNTDNDYYLNPIPSGSTVGANIDFNLDNMTGNVDSGFTGSLSSASSLLTQRKFAVAFQGGFDGISPSKPKATAGDITATNTMGYDCSTATSAGTKAYSYALGLLSNQDEYDVNMLLTPGIIKQLHPSVVSKGIDMVETRSDVFYIFDLVKLTETNLGTIVNEVLGLDSSYAATYHCWLKVLNSDSNQQFWVPPSVLLAGVIAYNDKVAYEWYAPAGLNRGGITAAVDIYTKLYQSDRDTLYDNRINPIASFPNTGIAVWGQKTLQVKASALDRINVRRLLIKAKKYIASISKYIVFEPSVNATWKQFSNNVNPYLEGIQSKYGLYTFKVQMDANNNTGDVIDRNEILGQLWLQPTKSGEKIILEFNVTNTSAIFNG
jgi:frataxin-like iron-binding protein CyaY